MGTEIVPLVNTLDSLRKVANNGSDFWMARDVQPHLGYATWESFSKVIEKAKMACESSGTGPRNHFRDTTKEVPIGSGAMAARADCYLSRYACYLIAMNGDPRKSEIGIAQTYFAVKTRQQELTDEHEALEKRVAVRGRVTDAVKALNVAAKGAGVQRYGLFHDAGYRGLYGMGLLAVKRKKNISDEDDLFDHAGRTELAANEFRLTQARDKLVRENIREERHAIETHKSVGEEVRDTIRKIGGTMPEDLAPEPSLKKLTHAKSRKALPKSQK